VGMGSKHTARQYLNARVKLCHHSIAAAPI
jgi:hypothetical protein